MFGHKDKEVVETTEDTAGAAGASARTGLPDASRMMASAPMQGRRPDMSHSRRTHTPPHDMGERKLTVGKGLSLAGEITACDVLVVEGKVEARLSDGKLLEITESGQFRGSVEIENADIAGRYDGELTVHGRLTIRGTGRITGIIKYGELEVNAGGQIIGEMQVVGGGAGAGNQKGPGFKSASKFTAASLDDEEKDDEGALFSRKTAVNS
jgi:cytoskeletal protein CcmA (bactofilin family)